MNIRIFTKEKKHITEATLLRGYNVKSLSFNKGVLNINDGENPKEFTGVEGFTIDIKGETNEK